MLIVTRSNLQDEIEIINLELETIISPGREVELKIRKRDLDRLLTEVKKGEAEQNERRKGSDNKLSMKHRFNSY